MASLFSAFVGEVRAFVGWWLQQLYDLARSSAEALIPSLKTRTIILLGREGGTVSMLRGRAFTKLFSFKNAASGVFPTDLAPFGSAEIIRGYRAAIGLSDEFVLTRELLLPEAAEQNLRGAVELYLEREFPLVLSALAIHYRVVDRLRADRQLRVRIEILQKQKLTDLVAVATTWGVHVVRVGRDRGGLVEGQFLTHMRKQVAWSRLDKMLAWSLGSMSIIAIVVVGTQWLVERHNAEGLIQALQPQALAAQRFAKVVESRAEPARFLSSVINLPDAAQVIAALTDRTPADTWIYRLSVKAMPGTTTSLELEAFTPPSLDYQTTLEKSAEFEQVRLISSQSDNAMPSQKRAKLSAVMSTDRPGARDMMAIASRAP